MPSWWRSALRGAIDDRGTADEVSDEQRAQHQNKREPIQLDTMATAAPLTSIAIDVPGLFRLGELLAIDSRSGLLDVDIVVVEKETAALALDGHI